LGEVVGPGLAVVADVVVDVFIVVAAAPGTHWLYQSLI
jgi:hypothetical protein